MKIYYPAWKLFAHRWINEEDIIDFPCKTPEEAEKYLEDHGYSGGSSEEEIAVFEYDSSTGRYEMMWHA